MMYFNQHFDKTKLRLFIAWLLKRLGGWQTINALERFKTIVRLVLWINKTTVIIL